MNTTPMSRIQATRCIRCGYVTWTWGMGRKKCLLCDPIPPKLAKLYKEKIDADDPLVKL